jgi:hypothetical protein
VLSLSHRRESFIIRGHQSVQAAVIRRDSVTTGSSYRGGSAALFPAFILLFDMISDLGRTLFPSLPSVSQGRTSAMHVTTEHGVLPRRVRKKQLSQSTKLPRTLSRS